jgi:hypothetical protein
VTNTGFIAAMHAELTLGDYDNPTSVGPPRSEWIIVSVWGASGEFLSLSLTNRPAEAAAPAPGHLKPETAHLGLLLARSETPDQQEEEFLLMRNRPPEVLVAGVFHPSDGYARVVRKPGVISLTARGRYAHCHGAWKGVPCIRDVPDPSPGFHAARSWHLVAESRPWIGEFLEGPPT